MNNSIEDKHVISDFSEYPKTLECTGVWKIGTTYKDVEGEFFNHIEFRYFNGLKPHWFHRLMARLLLGWIWEDKK